ncbi:serine/threonine-protein kinase chk1 [Zymoseptoria brevis]|uniref:Serine/threonine-protein kinase chk1 n=1 Tax=Zymoseptoria brevis TaxID=1047168 RepID=A0A0F4GIF7_9PEZI|nr:serine/threonine-protein kinase chk1 [Zymoseptoria brevis]
MGAPPNSQAVPLPNDLPFRLVSKTIGSGAYASIRKAIPRNASGPIIAIKFINKEHAFRAGRLREKQLDLELALHAAVCQPLHQNIIRYFSHGKDTAWVWMAMELAEGGDLFDKIEADEGVGEDIAHFYFTQLVSAISWCHGKGVAHRDIKPENMLLSGGGDLKLADFGLATQFLSPKTGERKTCGMVCGSPPYIAPEILAVGNANQSRKPGEEKVGYDPQIADVWSCAIVLFVLLVGNTPWDAPIMEESFEYHDYVTSNGRPSDELWSKIPGPAVSLIRAMLNIESTERFTMESVRKHPWFTRANSHLSREGKAANPLGLATEMLEGLKIDFDAPVQSSQHQRSQPEDSMDIDSHHPATQPETPITDSPFDWEAPPRAALRASQPANHNTSIPQPHISPAHMSDLFSDDPSLSQFSQKPTVPMTLTQVARKFKDIVPSHSLARFLSVLPIPSLVPVLLSALHRLNIPVATPTMEGNEPVALRIRTLDSRGQALQGSIMVERIPVPGQSGLEVSEVRFVKAKGDPVGWRRFFKQVAVLCKDGIVVPGSSQGGEAMSQ